MPSVRCQTANTSIKSPDQAAEDLLTQLGSFSAKVVFAFIPGPYDHHAHHQALRARLPKETRLITSSTGGELTNDGYRTETIVVSALGGDLDVGVGWATGLSQAAVMAGGDAIDKAAADLGIRVSELDRRYGAVVIDDSVKTKLDVRKEEMLLGVLDKNQSLVLVGGGASSYEFMSGKTWMGVDGNVFTDGLVLMLFRTNAPWGALRSHAFEPLGKRVRITKVDETSRRILELDGQSAGARLAELTGYDPEHLTVKHMDKVLRIALAMRVGREYFIRNIDKSLEGDWLEAPNMFQDDQELEVMRAVDIVTATQRFFQEELPRRVPNPTAALLFDCGARRLYAQLTGQLDALGATLKYAPPAAGLTVLFETYCGFMVSGTLTTLVFGSS